MNHISKIAGKLEDYGLDAMLVTSESGELYALGFHGEGLLLITKNGGHYSTDGRYIEAAREKIAQVEVKCVGGEATHLSMAKEYIEANGLHNVGFESGAMTVDEHRHYAQELPCILTPAQSLLDDLRAAKDEEEMEAMKKAQKITDDAFRAILSFIRPGMTEREVAARLVYEMMRMGADKVSFDHIVAAGPNGSRPHAIPGDRVIEQGMFVTMDFGCKVDGYCSDMTRTVAVGHVTDEMREIYNTVLQAQLAGLAASKAGVPGDAIDGAARKVITDAGYGPYFGHGYGHSLGLEVHEAPSPNARNAEPMPLHSVASAEPGIYLPGKFGVRIEDCVVFTEDGYENLATSPKNLIIV